MKRNMDLVRAILIVLEKNPSEYTDYRLARHIVSRPHLFSLNIDPDDLEFHIQFDAHTKMMREAGLIESSYVNQTFPDDEESDLCLTWEGHEFLANIRELSVWEKVKRQCGDASFTVIKQIAVEIARQFIQDKT